MDIQPYIKKEVKLILRNGFHYEGRILEADEKSFVLRDRYGKVVYIALSNVDLLEIIPANRELK